MSGTLLDQVAQLQQDLHLVQSTVAALRTKLDALVAPLQAQACAEGRPVQFTDLEGVWAGIDLSFAAIAESEYQMPEKLP